MLTGQREMVCVRSPLRSGAPEPRCQCGILLDQAIPVPRHALKLGVKLRKGRLHSAVRVFICGMAARVFAWMES